MMPLKTTTKDLAKHLGLSRSTVDRVLNGRPGVKEETEKVVRKAIEALGFERNLSAANLARSRVYRFQFLLPAATGEFMSAVEAQITELAAAVSAENIDIAVHRVLDTDQHKTVELLAGLSSDQVDGIAIMAPDSPQVRDAITRLGERGVHVVRILSGQVDTETSRFIGIDNVAAGKTAARLLGGLGAAKSGHVVVVTDWLASRESVARRTGFDTVLQEKFSSLSALATLETHGDQSRTERVLQSAFRNYKDIVGVYVMSSEAGMMLNALSELDCFGPIVAIAHECTPTTVRYLLEEKVDALIAQNPGHVVRSAVRLLKSKCDDRPPLASQEEIRIEILLKENLADSAIQGVKGSAPSEVVH